MQDLKDFIKQYLEQYEHGNIGDIMQYLMERNLFIEETLSSLRNKVEEILRSMKNVHFSDSTRNFTFENVNLSRFPMINEFASHQCLLSGTILQNSPGLNLNAVSKFIKERIDKLGKYSCSVSTVDDENSHLNGFFETTLIQVSFFMNQKEFTIKSMMRSQITSKEPFIYYAASLPNNSIRKERFSYMPLNFGIYLIFDIINEYIRSKEQKLELKVDFLEFIQ